MGLCAACSCSPARKLQRVLVPEVSLSAQPVLTDCLELVLGAKEPPLPKFMGIFNTFLDSFALP